MNKMICGKCFRPLGIVDMLLYKISKWKLELLDQRTGEAGKLYNQAFFGDLND